MRNIQKEYTNIFPDRRIHTNYRQCQETGSFRHVNEQHVKSFRYSTVRLTNQAHLPTPSKSLSCKKIQSFGNTEHSSIAWRYPIYKAAFAAYAQSAGILKNCISFGNLHNSILLTTQFHI